GRCPGPGGSPCGGSGCRRHGPHRPGRRVPGCVPRRGRSGSLRPGRRPGSRRGRSERLGDPPGSRQVLIASRGGGHVTPGIPGAPGWELRRAPPPSGFIIIPRAAGLADMIVDARLFITNTDFVERFRLDAPLNLWDVRSFYGGDDHGSTDYPTLAEPRSPDPDTAGLRTSVGRPKLFRIGRLRCVETESKTVPYASPRDATKC